MRTLLAIFLGLALLAGCAAEAEEPASSEEPVETPEAPDDSGVEEAPAEAAPAEEAPDDAGAEDSAGEQADGEIMVSIGDFFFEPESISIAVGDTVTWTHDGDITHNVTARDDSFASDNMSSGESFSHTFDTAGSFEYRCTLHGQMVATVEVG